MTIEEINQQVDQVVLQRSEEVIVGMFEAVKKRHCKVAQGSDCPCDYCRLCREYTRYKIRRHRIRRIARNDDDSIFPSWKNAFLRSVPNYSSLYTEMMLVEASIANLRPKLKALKQ